MHFSQKIFCFGKGMQFLCRIKLRLKIRGLQERIFRYVKIIDDRRSFGRLIAMSDSCRRRSQNVRTGVLRLIATINIKYANQSRSGLTLPRKHLAGLLLRWSPLASHQPHAVILQSAYQTGSRARRCSPLARQPHDRPSRNIRVDAAAASRSVLKTRHR